jgi:hypothetical protein
MTTKKIFLVIILFTVTAVLFGEELEYITIRKTMLYDNTKSSFDKFRDALFEIDKDIKVKVKKRTPYKITGATYYGMYIGYFIYDDKEYYIDCSDLVPANTVDIFEQSLISDLESNNRKIWVPSYYIEVLQSQNRDTLLIFDKYWKESFDWIDGNWYFYPHKFDISNSILAMHTQTTMMVMMIKNIIRTNNNYNVTVSFKWYDNWWWEYHENHDYNWYNIENKEVFDMILCVDGEYMDVYLDDMEHKLTTFMLVDNTFLKELRLLIEKGESDPSRVRFPSRADGSIDYQPPELLSDTVISQTEDETLENAIEKNALPQNNDKKISLPLWAWFVFIGIAIAVSGGVAVFVVLMRKKAG